MLISHRVSVRVCGALVLGAATSLFGAGLALAEQFKVVTAVPDKMTGGTTAFVDTIGKQRIVEIDSRGTVVWQCSLRGSSFNLNYLHSGADLKWIKADDTFQVVIPLYGIFRMNRACQVTWRYLTPKVSHDAVLLENGDVLYTFGWDTEADSQAVEIDPSGKIVWSWQASGKVDPAWRRVPEKPSRQFDTGSGPGRRSIAGGSDEMMPSYSHANAVVRLVNGDTLVSRRNFNRVFRVAPDGSIRRAWGPIPRVHDPSLLPDGTLVAAEHHLNQVIALGGGMRRVIFDNPIRIWPIRTVQPLERGNFLLTGGEDIVEIDGSGTVVWRVKIYEGLGSKQEQGVYKAVRIEK